MARPTPEIVHPVELADTPAWLRAMRSVFLDDPNGPSVDRWTEVLRRTWEPARAWGARDGGRWVATLRTEARTLTIPGPDGTIRELAADAVTNVTVSATHRRQGLMSQMLDGALGAARARGDAVSILIAAEWPIYGRFGYAPATWSADYVLHRRRVGGVQASQPLDVRGSDAEEIAAVGAEVFAAFCRRRAGQVNRDQRWWDIALGQDGFPAPPPEDELPHNWIVHEGEDGIDGILGWRAAQPGELNVPGRVEIWGLFAANERADQSLWAYVSGIELVDEITLEDRPIDEPARWLLTDGRSLTLESHTDFLWLHVLDVPAALTARSYSIDGEIVLDVRDDAPATSIDAGGRYALRSSGDMAECVPTDRPADIELTQRALASIYLGGVRPAELLPSRAVTELSSGALERARLMFSAPQAPWNATGF